MALLLAMLWFIVLMVLVVNGYMLLTVIWIGAPIVHFAEKVTRR